METNRGLAVTTNSVAVVDSIDQFCQQILASGTSPQLILDAVKQHPDNLLLCCYTAAFYLYAQRDPATAIAKEYLSQAEKLLPATNLREKLTYYAIQAWMNLDYHQAITLFTSLTELYPRDILAAKFTEWLFYCVGQISTAQDYLALCQHMAADNQDEPNFLAMHAFAFELAGELSAAQREAEKALMLDPQTPWAHHALAHVYLNKNQGTEGIKRMEQFQRSWDFISPLMRGHNSWHLALFYLAMRQQDKVMTLFPAIFGTCPDITTEQIDGISLLWRLDLAGFVSSKAFEDIVIYLQQAPFEHYIGFNSLHYIYCLARSGKDIEVQKSLASIRAYAQSLPTGYKQWLWTSVIVPFSQALAAFVKGDFLSASREMAPCITRYMEMGGSDAQAELFAQTYLVCLLRLRKHSAADAFFKQYLRHYQDTPLAEYWFSLTGFGTRYDLGEWG